MNPIREARASLILDTTTCYCGDTFGSKCGYCDECVADLTEREKDNDREQADKILAVMEVKER